MAHMRNDSAKRRILSRAWLTNKVDIRYLKDCLAGPMEFPANVEDANSYSAIFSGGSDSSD